MGLFEHIWTECTKCKSTSIALLAVFAIGALYLLALATRFVKALVLRPLLGGGLLRKYKKDGAWAVVTGATDGIGKAFSIQLAKRGFNVLLISRTADKLEAVKAEVEAVGVKAAVVAVDFANAGSADYARIKDALNGKNVTVLINNVGLSYDHAAFFHEVDQKRIDDIITLNIKSMHDMTRIVLPYMREKKCGLVLNISSASAYLPSPAYVSTYGASKAYVVSWTRGMADEYKREGIHFETIVPWFVSTAMSKARPSMMIPKPEVYARSALNWVGAAAEHTGYFWHELQQFVVTELPEFITRGRAVGFHADIRRRALAKKAREAAGEGAKKDK